MADSGACALLRAAQKEEAADRKERRKFKMDRMKLMAKMGKTLEKRTKREALIRVRTALVTRGAGRCSAWLGHLGSLVMAYELLRPARRADQRNQSGYER